MHFPLLAQAPDDSLSVVLPLLLCFAVTCLIVILPMLSYVYGSSTATPIQPRSVTSPINPPLLASTHFADHKSHLLIACTGSVATIKLPNILAHFATHPSLSIRVLLSSSAAQFLQGQADEQPALAALRKTPNVDAIYLDADEWARPWTRGAPILHIELRRWADLMLIAPLSANALATITQGRSSDLISSVVRAWDTTGLIDVPRPGVTWGAAGPKRIIVAPAMNTAMWSHPITAKQIAVLECEWGWTDGGWFEVLRPVEKELACGDTGSGAMRDWKEIVDIVSKRINVRVERGEE